MSERHIRGSRMGAQSLQTEDGVKPADRQHQSYSCQSCGSVFEIVLAAEAEAPDSWECKRCGRAATLGESAGVELMDVPVGSLRHRERTGRTHWEMLRERRTIPELEVLLEERLTYLRSKRGEI